MSPLVRPQPAPPPAPPPADGWTRRQWLAGAGAAAGLMVTGCDRMRSLWPAALRGQLRLYIFDDYIPASLLQRFTRQTGYGIHLETYFSNDELYEKLKSEQVQCDLIMPSDFVARHMRDEGLLVPLDTAKIPRLELVDRALYNASFDPNNRHTVPFIWGSTGIGYDSGRVSGLPKSWAALFTRQERPRLPDAFLHRRPEVLVSVMDDSRFVIGCALIYLGLDPNTRNPAEITRAADALMHVRDRIDYFASDHVPELLRSRTVGLAMAWTGDVARAMRGFMASPESGGPPVMRPGNNQVRIALPGEGSILFRDSFAVPAMGQNYEAAHAFIDFLLDPSHAAEVTNYSCYANTVPGSAAHVDRFVFNGPAYFRHPAGRNFQLEYSEETGPLHARLWQEIKGGGSALPVPAIQSSLPDHGAVPPA